MSNPSLPGTRRKFAEIALIALITIPQTRAANITWSSSAPADGNWHTATDPGAVSDASTGSYDKVVENGEAGSVTGDSAVFKIVLGGNAFSDPFWNTTKRWTDLFTGTGTPANISSIFSTFAGSNINPDGTVIGNAGHFSFNGTSTLTWSAVPEPTGALSGLLLSAGLMRRRRPATAAGHGA